MCSSATWRCRKGRLLAHPRGSGAPAGAGGSTPAACLTGRIEAEDRARVLRGVPVPYSCR
jgi:hypothetical protein